MHGVGASFPIRLEIVRKLYRRPGTRAGRGGARPRTSPSQEGETLCLIGPSGAGKTTTLRILIGHRPRLRGPGLARSAQPAHRHGLPGAAAPPVAQRRGQCPSRAAAAAAPADPRARCSRSRPRSRGGRASRANCPGGMQRRVALARALAIEPVLLVLDEPFVSLDDHAAAELRQVVFDVAGQRRLGVIMVTHNVREALGLARPPAPALAAAGDPDRARSSFASPRPERDAALDRGAPQRARGALSRDGGGMIRRPFAR